MLRKWNEIWYDLLIMTIFVSCKKKKKRKRLCIFLKDDFIDPQFFLIVDFISLRISFCNWIIVPLTFILLKYLSESYRGIG